MNYHCGFGHLSIAVRLEISLKTQSLGLRDRGLDCDILRHCESKQVSVGPEHIDKHVMSTHKLSNLRKPIMVEALKIVNALNFLAFLDLA